MTCAQYWWPQPCRTSRRSSHSWAPSDSLCWASSSRWPWRPCGTGTRRKTMTPDRNPTAWKSSVINPRTASGRRPRPRWTACRRRTTTPRSARETSRTSRTTVTWPAAVAFSAGTCGKPKTSCWSWWPCSRCSAAPTSTWSTSSIRLEAISCRRWSNRAQDDLLVYRVVRLRRNSAAQSMSRRNPHCGPYCVLCRACHTVNAVERLVSINYKNNN